jgi:hypothetical protein
MRHFRVLHSSMSPVEGGTWRFPCIVKFDKMQSGGLSIKIFKRKSRFPCKAFTYPRMGVLYGSKYRRFQMSHAIAGAVLIGRRNVVVAYG